MTTHPSSLGRLTTHSRKRRRPCRPRSRRTAEAPSKTPPGALEPTSWPLTVATVAEACVASCSPFRRLEAAGCRRQDKPLREPCRTTTRQGWCPTSTKRDIYICSNDLLTLSGRALRSLETAVSSNFHLSEPPVPNGLPALTLPERPCESPSALRESRLERIAETRFARWSCFHGLRRDGLSPP